MEADPVRQRLEQAVADRDLARFELTLFVSGASIASSKAIRDVRTLCDTHLAGRHVLTVVDVSHNPEAARTRRVLATPTLVKDFPAPIRMLVGDLSDADRVLIGLDVPKGSKSGP